MGKIKALFFDIDGTLVDWQVGILTPQPSVMAELRRIQGLGHRIFISSGRPWPLIGEGFHALGFDGYVVNNGGHVQVGDVTIYEERLAPQAARAAARVLEEEGVQYAIDTAHHVYVDQSYADMWEFLDIHHDVLSADFRRDEALTRTIKLECCPPDGLRPHLRERYATELAGIVACGDNGTGGTFELYSPDLSKALGIQHVMDYLGIAVEDTYAFGDGLNDLEMIEFCGCGVAMGNAAPEVKATADLVCGTVVDNGLARILHELF